MAKDKPKQDKSAELWAALGKLSVDIELTKTRQAQLQQKYQEVYQSLQQIKSMPKPSSPEVPKTSD